MNQSKNTPPQPETVTHPEYRLSELKKGLDIQRGIQAEGIKSARSILSKEDFRGKQDIQVLPDFKDASVIYIKSSLAQLQIDLHYDESREYEDSLRKNTKNFPEVSLTGEIDGALYSIEGYSIEDTAKIAGELLKQIEQKKYPESFGFKSITFGLLPNNEIALIGERSDGTRKQLNFFNDYDDRVVLYGYISHFFDIPLIRIY